MNHYGNTYRPRTQALRSSCTRQASCCVPDTSSLVPLPLAMAYVPIQTWGETYTPEKALCRGTVFPVLDLPFTRGGCSL